MQRSTTTPDEFLAALADDERAEMAELDSLIADVMKGDERVLWEGKFWGGTQQYIIGYGSYHYIGRSGAEGEWFIVGLARQKDYISVYVNASEDGAYLARRYAERLGQVKVGSANVTFRRLPDVELPALREMIARARELMTRSDGAGDTTGT
jgi:hypothetical protein